MAWTNTVSICRKAPRVSSSRSSYHLNYDPFLVPRDRVGVFEVSPKHQKVEVIVPERTVGTSGYISALKPRA
jgi:hypothetical protein